MVEQSKTQAPAAPDGIQFVRLTDISLDDLYVHMSDPRVAEHMPLLTAAWTRDDCAGFVAAKEACWAEDGLGHWGILSDGRYVGWGGFQKEGDDWDLGLVLDPREFGLGPRIVRKMLAFAASAGRFDYVTFLLPPSRRHLGALARLGAKEIGTVDYAGQTFRKFSLDVPK